MSVDGRRGDDEVRKVALGIGGKQRLQRAKVVFVEPMSVLSGQQWFTPDESMKMLAIDCIGDAILKRKLTPAQPANTL